MSFELIASEWRKARKPHKCIWCGEAIVIGETYKHQRGKFDGEPQSNDWHRECDEEAGQPGYRYEMQDGFEAYSYPRPPRLPDSTDTAGGKGDV